jgi:hypothetical protein
MSTVQNLAGDTANVAKGTDPSSFALLVGTGNVNAITSLAAQSSANTAGSTVDFGMAQTYITCQFYGSATLTGGTVNLEVSQDNVHWTLAGAALAATGIDAGNLAVGTEANTIATSVITVAAGAWRYARAVVLTAITGGTITAVISAS